MAGTDAEPERKGAIMVTSNDIERIVGSAYAAHRGPLQRYLTSLTRDVAAAEDLTQDAFVRLTREVQSGRVPDNAGAWLHRVGHNLAMSRGRRMSVADRRRGDLVRSDTSPSPESLTVADEERRAVSAALEGLGRQDRKALVLASHGYRGSEIARSIGRTEGATRTILCRARARVRMQMLAGQPG